MTWELPAEMLRTLTRSDVELVSAAYFFNLALASVEERPSSWAELFECLSELPQVRQIHLAPPSAEGEAEQVWIVVEEFSPGLVQRITDTVVDVELEYEEMWEIRVVLVGNGPPRDVRASLTKDPVKPP